VRFVYALRRNTELHVTWRCTTYKAQHEMTSHGYISTAYLPDDVILLIIEDGDAERLETEKETNIRRNSVTWLIVELHVPLR
jgi:hypothetical protein